MLPLASHSSSVPRPRSSPYPAVGGHHSNFSAPMRRSKSPPRQSLDSQPGRGCAAFCAASGLRLGQPRRRALQHGSTIWSTARRVWKRWRRRCFRSTPLRCASLKALRRACAQISRADARVRLLTSTPGVGPLVALTYVAAIDDPFTSSNSVGHILGSLRKSINRVRPMSAAGSARWATVRCAPPSMRPPTSS